jgi:ABC-2 type transport system ATP-binding protein
VLTTHAIDEAEQLADEVVIVDAGRVVAAGSPASLIGTGEQHLELRFDAVPGLALSGLLVELPAGSSASETAPGRYLIAGDITPNVAATVTSWCAGQGVMPDRITTGARTLEDVFLSLTGKQLRT